MDFANDNSPIPIVELKLSPIYTVSLNTVFSIPRNQCYPGNPCSRFVESGIVTKCDELDRYLEVNEDEDTLKNEVLHSVATALANMVLPFVFRQVDFFKNPKF